MNLLLATLLAAGPGPGADVALFEVPDGGSPESIALAATALRSPSDPELRRRALVAGVLSGESATLADQLTRVAVRVQLGLDPGSDGESLSLWAAQHKDAPLAARLLPWLKSLKSGRRLPVGAVDLGAREQRGTCEALWYLDLGALPEAELVATLTLRDVNLPALGTAWRRLGVSDERINQAKAATASSSTAWWAALHGLIAVGRWSEALAWYQKPRPAPGPLHAAYAPALHALLLALEGQTSAAAAEQAKVKLRLPAAPAGVFIAAAHYVEAVGLKAQGKSTARAAFRAAREAIETHDPDHPLWDLACAGEGGGVCQQPRPRHRYPQGLEVYGCSPLP